MMIRNRDDARAELDALRALRGRREEHLGRRDRLPSAGMMLTDPELVVAEAVEQGREFEVALELEHRMFADRMMRSEKNAKAKPVVHDGLH